MKPARFSYEAPDTLAAALAALAARREDAKVIAGGQSLAPMMNMRLAQPGHLIDINAIVELADIRLEHQRLAVGALARHADLARDPLVLAHAPMLAHAAASIGHYAIRQRGTLGGSLAHADPAAQLPLVAVALDAEIELVSSTGRRIVPAADFFQSIFTTALRSDELVAAVQISLPAAPGWGFRLFTRRAGDFALVAVAVTIRRSPSGAIECPCVVAGGIAARPIRLDAAGLLERIDFAGPDWASHMAQGLAASAEIEATEDVSAEYRQELLAVLLQEALSDARRRAA